MKDRVIILFNVTVTLALFLALAVSAPFVSEGQLLWGCFCFLAPMGAWYIWAFNFVNGLSNSPPKYVYIVIGWALIYIIGVFVSSYIRLPLYFF